MMIKIQKTPKDSKIVAKAILVDPKGRVLLLKRTSYMKKFANELDLPGGHVHIGEDIVTGLLREVKEETDLDLTRWEFVKKVKNIHFYLCECKNFNIKLSDEHSEYLFKEVDHLDINNRFENICKEILGHE